jgi:hypothetical protein
MISIVGPLSCDQESEQSWSCVHRQYHIAEDCDAQASAVKAMLALLLACCLSLHVPPSVQVWCVTTKAAATFCRVCVYKCLLQHISSTIHNKCTNSTDTYRTDAC